MTIGWGDVAPLAAARSRFSAPRHWGPVVHAVIAAFCWPAFALGFLVVRRGWFHRDGRRLVVRLVRRRPVPWWYFLVGYLVARVVVDVLRGLLGDVVVLVAYLLLAYALAVAVLAWIRSREVRPKAERQGFLRPGGIPDAPWVLERVEHRDGLGDASMRAVRDLVETVVPAGEPVGAAPASDADERRLLSIGFEPKPGMRGHVVLTR